MLGDLVVCSHSFMVKGSCMLVAILRPNDDSLLVLEPGPAADGIGHRPIAADPPK
jgi:hypothetical protein